MRRTVVGVFDRQDAARDAIAALTRSGFDRGHIHVARSRPHATAAVVAAPRPAAPGMLDVLGRFVAEAWGDAPGDDPPATGAVVQVDVDDSALAPRAELALVVAGAVDITHRSG